MRLLLFLLLLIPSESRPVELHLTASLPCYEPSFSDSFGCYEDSLSGRFETGLDSLIVYGWRFGDQDTVRLGALSVRGFDCDQYPFAVQMPSGSMGELQAWLKDRAGKLSCRPIRYVFALPLVDSLTEAQVGRDYDLVWRKP